MMSVLHRIALLLSAASLCFLLDSCSSSPSVRGLPRNLPPINIHASAETPPHNMERKDYPFDANGNYVTSWAALAGAPANDSDFDSWKSSHGDGGSRSSRKQPSPVKKVTSSSLKKGSSDSSSSKKKGDSGSSGSKSKSGSGSPSKSKPKSDSGDKPKPKSDSGDKPKAKSDSGSSSKSKSDSGDKPKPKTDSGDKPKAKSDSGSASKSKSNSGDKPKAKSDSGSSGKSKSDSGDKPKAKSGSSGGGYTVKPGDTLSSIARKNNTTVSKLKAANGLSSDVIRDGKPLKIPK